MARKLTKDQIISNVYYDLESGFGSVNETLKKAKEQDPTIIKVGFYGNKNKDNSFWQ